MLLKPDTCVTPKSGELWQTHQGSLIQILICPALLHPDREHVVIYQDFLNLYENPIVCTLDDFVENHFTRISEPFHYLQERIARQSQTIVQLREEIARLRGDLLSSNRSL